MVHRIVDQNREAFHAGRSMWCGREECDNHSIGIEVVGFHNKPVTLAQLDAIRDLVAILKKEYRLNDTQVVCHSHVAYGAPNKWQRKNHRGRKRCGMLFAMSSVRQRLNLKSKPAYDPDVRAKRLTVGDPYLEKVLYGNIDTMAGKLGRNVASDPKKFFSNLFSKKPPEMSNEPEKENYYEKPKVASLPKSIEKSSSKTSTISKAHLKMSAAVQSDDPKTLRDLEDRARYKEVGVLGKRMSPYKLTGKHWNSNSTFYYLKGKVIRGDLLDPKKVSPGTRVFQRK